MSDETGKSLQLDAELRERLVAEAEAEGSSISEFLDRLLRDHVSGKGKAPGYDAWGVFEQADDASRDTGQAHDAWFRKAVAEGLKEADSSMIPHDEIVKEWQAERSALHKAIGKSD